MRVGESAAPRGPAAAARRLAPVVHGTIMKLSAGTERTRDAARPAVALAALLLLAACAGENRQIVCPPVLLVPDADRMVKFDERGSDLTDVRFEVELQEPSIACQYDDGANAIDADLTVRFVTAIGPAEETRQAQFRYFVAIATAVGRRIVARQEFDLSVPFQEGQSRMAVTEGVEPRIPLNPSQDGSEFEVFVGLALSKQELEYNRRNR